MPREYTDHEICQRMRHSAWVRECCEKVIRLTVKLRAGGSMVEHMQFFFITSWRDDLSRIACFNAFLQTSEYLMDMFDGLDDIAAGRRALAEDIIGNVYAVWIPVLCARTRAVAPAVGQGKRQLSLPIHPWAVCYGKDPLIRKLETLYAACAPMTKAYTKGSVLVRLNGEHQAL